VIIPLESRIRLQANAR